MFPSIMISEAFSQVSLGSQRLQKLVRIFEKNYLGNFYSFGPGPDVMLILPEAELHMLGMVLAAGMFRKEGANPTVVVGRHLEEVFNEIESREFSLVGISLVNREKLSDIVKLARHLKMRFKDIPLCGGRSGEGINLETPCMSIYTYIDNHKNH